MSRHTMNLTGTARYIPETTDRKALLRLTETTRQRPEVAILGRSGGVVQRKTGEVSEDGTRCFVRYEGDLVDATKTDAGWVYDPHAKEESNDD